MSVRTIAGSETYAPPDAERAAAQCMMSLRRLGVETIDLFQLHRIDEKVPREEQFGLLKELKDEGKVREVGLSQVTVEEIEAAREVVAIASVQNRYNLADQSDADVLEYCQQEGIAFIPWAPIDAGKLAGSDSPIGRAAEHHGVTAGAVALAWLLHRSPVIVPIPGTSKVAHLQEKWKRRALTSQPRRSPRSIRRSRLERPSTAPSTSTGSRPNSATDPDNA